MKPIRPERERERTLVNKGKMKNWKVGLQSSTVVSCVCIVPPDTIHRRGRGEFE